MRRDASGSNRRGAPGVSGQTLSRLVGLALLGVLLMAGGSGCTTRANRPTVSPDSTMVYASRIPGDVNASITFALKGSKKRAEERRLAREQAKLAREQARQAAREKARLAAEQKRAAEKERKAAEKRARREQERAKKGKKHHRSGTDEQTAAPDQPGAIQTAAYKLDASQPAPDQSNNAADSAGAATVADSGAAGSAATASSGSSSESDEHVFDLEDGARVQANIHIVNPYGRGKGPLLFHMVWLNPEDKKVFKKAIEWTPSDTSSTITGQFTIPPSKRTAGLYSLQVYLFRELIAEKHFELRGVSTAVEEKEQGGGM